MDARELYQLPREEFTAARNALAAELKKDGDPEGAAEVKGLPKPSNPAWLANRAAAEEPAAAKRLLEAGATLRDAYANAAGEGGRQPLREAIEAERAAVEELMSRAADLAIEAEVGGTALDKARETLHALSSDDELRAQFEAGIVAKERKASGLGGVIAPGGGGGSGKGGGSAGSRAGGGSAKTQKAKADRAREKKIRAARERAEEASRELEEARTRLRIAEASLAEKAEAERAARKALKDAERER